MRVTLNGPVMGDELAKIYQYYGYSVICPKDVRTALQDNPEGEELVLELNSGGGSVFAGFEIYTLLASASVHTVAEVQSLSASAASTIASACRRVMMSPVAQMMIHLPTTSTYGDRDDHAGSVQLLDSIASSILNGYERKVGGKRTRQQLEQMMRQATWLDAEAAVETGLADGILFAQEEDPAAQAASVVNAAGSCIRAAAAAWDYPDPAQLRARFQAEQDNRDPAGAPPALPDNAWAVRAKLEIEKNRF